MTKRQLRRYASLPAKRLYALGLPQEDLKYVEVNASVVSPTLRRRFILWRLKVENTGGNKKLWATMQAAGLFLLGVSVTLVSQFIAHLLGLA